MFPSTTELLAPLKKCYDKNLLRTSSFFLLLYLNVDIFYLWHNSQSHGGQEGYSPCSFLPGAQVMVGNLLPAMKRAGY